MFIFVLIITIVRAYNFSNNYEAYIFEGISDYKVFLSALKRVQSLEKFMDYCRKHKLSGFYEGQWILTNSDAWFELGTQSTENENLGPDFEKRGYSQGKAEFAI